MKYMVIALATLLLTGCSSDGPTEPVGDFEGLRAHGTVTTPDGDPVVGVTIAVRKRVGTDLDCRTGSSLGPNCHEVRLYGDVVTTSMSDSNGAYSFEQRWNCDAESDFWITYLGDWSDAVGPDWRNPFYWEIKVEAPGYVSPVIDNMVSPDRTFAECDSDRSFNFLLEPDA